MQRLYGRSMLARSNPTGCGASGFCCRTPQVIPNGNPASAHCNKSCKRLGWTRGGNLEFDERWTTDNMDLVRANAANLVELKPDVIVALGGRVIPVLLQLTSTVPVIIPGTADAIGSGYIKSLARPGGNVTGFASMEFSVFSKILETLKEIAPKTSRVAMIYNPDNPNTINTRRLFESSAVPLSVQPITAPIHTIADIEGAIEALAEQPNGGAFFPPDVTVASLPTTRIVPTYFAGPHPTSTVFCAGKNPAICRFSSRRNTSSRSTSRPPKLSGSNCLRHCLLAPTR